MLELRYPAGTNEERSADVEGIGHRREVLPDRVLIYADDGEAALKPKCTHAAANRNRRSSVGARSKTCSSG